MTHNRPPGSRRGFTLIEVVLAIGLTATVVYLLSTAIELHLANVESSRSRVETAQLARTLLDQIAADLNAIALTPQASPSGGGFASAMRQQSGGATGGGATGNGAAGGAASGAAGGQSGGASGGAQPGAGSVSGVGASGGSSGTASGGGAARGSATGLFGTLGQLRIDRAAYANWERASREIQATEAATQADMPISVRYFFVKDNRITTQRAAQQGVARPLDASGAAGLFRETMSTSSIDPLDPPLPADARPRSGARVELLAPEVMAMEFAYFDGTKYAQEWDPALDGGLPIGIEITLTIAQPRFQPRPGQEEQERLEEGRFRESELIEYRRFVRLPLVAASPPAQPLLPAGGQQGGGRAFNAGGPGNGGQGNPGGGASGGQSGGGQAPGGGG
jgi:hypothetical protein